SKACWQIFVVVLQRWGLMALLNPLRLGFRMRNHPIFHTISFIQNTRRQRTSCQHLVRLAKAVSTVWLLLAVRLGRVNQRLLPHPLSYFVAKTR
ncbi:MAG: hypothetical protein ACDS79_10640, partial [Enterobacteriaceae bacterium]